MKESWKPGTMIYPLPAVLVGCGDAPDNWNLLTVAWTGTVCTAPPMLLPFASLFSSDDDNTV